MFYLVGAVFVIVLIGMVIHMIAFGTIFGVIVKRFADASQQQQAARAAQQPRECSYCGTSIPAGTADCPGCGATEG